MVNKVVTEEAAKSSGIISTFPMIDNKRYKGTRIELGQYRVTVTSSTGTYPLTYLSETSEGSVNPVRFGGFHDKIHIF
jgi:hypothetical protein